MNSEHDTGGPAYPLKNYTSEIGPDNAGFTATDIVGNKFWVNSGAPGMTLWDKHVGQIVAAAIREGVAGSPPPTDQDMERIVAIAEQFADTMIRGKRRREGE